MTHESIDQNEFMTPVKLDGIETHLPIGKAQCWRVIDGEHPSVATEIVLVAPGYFVEACRHEEGDEVLDAESVFPRRAWQVLEGRNLDSATVELFKRILSSGNGELPGAHFQWDDVRYYANTLSNKLLYVKRQWQSGDGFSTFLDFEQLRIAILELKELIGQSEEITKTQSTQLKPLLAEWENVLSQQRQVSDNFDNSGADQDRSLEAQVISAVDLQRVVDAIDKCLAECRTLVPTFTHLESPAPSRSEPSAENELCLLMQIRAHDFGKSADEIGQLLLLCKLGDIPSNQIKENILRHSDQLRRADPNRWPREGANRQKEAENWLVYELWELGTLSRNEIADLVGVEVGDPPDKDRGRKLLTRVRDWFGQNTKVSVRVDRSKQKGGRANRPSSGKLLQ